MKHVFLDIGILLILYMILSVYLVRLKIKNLKIKILVLEELESSASINIINDFYTQAELYRDATYIFELKKSIGKDIRSL